MEKLGINLGYLLVHILNFAILFVVLRAWVYKPVLGILEKRRLAIAQGQEDARIAADARKNAETEAKKIIAEAEKKSAEIINESSERADFAARDIKAQAEAEVSKLRAQGLTDIDNERSRMLRDLRGQVGAISMSAARKIIGDSLNSDPAAQHRLLSDFFSDVRGGRMAMLERAGQTEAESIEVVSAMPLTEQEQADIKADLAKVITNDAPVHYRVDPAILGGLLVKMGDRVMDGTVQSQLQEMKEKLN